MRIKEYNQLFRQLAATHENLRANKFLRMTLSSDPVSRMLDLNEFNASLRSKVKPGYFMVLQSYEVEYLDNGADNRQKVYHGAMIILRAVKEGDFDHQEEVLDKAEQIAEEIMAAVLEQFKGNSSPMRRMTANDLSAEQIGPVGDNFYGCRMNFSFTRTDNKALKYNPAKFLQASNGQES